MQASVNQHAPTYHSNQYGSGRKPKRNALCMGIRTIGFALSFINSPESTSYKLLIQLIPLMTRKIACSRPISGLLLSRYVHQARSEDIKWLFENGALLNQNGRAVTVAAANGDIKSLEILLQNRMPVDAGEPENQDPLCKAAKHGHIDAVILLVNNGAPIDGGCIYNFPLREAALNGHDHVVEYLLANSPYRSRHLPTFDEEERKQIQCSKDFLLQDLAKKTKGKSITLWRLIVDGANIENLTQQQIAQLYKHLRRNFPDFSRVVGHPIESVPQLTNDLKDAAKILNSNSLLSLALAKTQETFRKTAHPKSFFSAWIEKNSERHKQLPLPDKLHNYYSALLNPSTQNHYLQYSE